MITSSSALENVSKYAPFYKYEQDVYEYLGMDANQVFRLAEDYNNDDIKKYDDHLEYYGTRGNSQLARQLVYHKVPQIIRQQKLFHSLVDVTVPGKGADFGCGSAPVGFHFALGGHKMDFIDVNGCAAYSFTKWRAKKYGLDCGWELNGPYDYVLMMDALEHIADWRGALDDVISSLKPGGGILTNYFSNTDFKNPEHVSMDHVAVKEHLLAHGIITDANEFLWVKRVEEKAA